MKKQKYSPEFRAYVQGRIDDMVRLGLVRDLGNGKYQVVKMSREEAARRTGATLDEAKRIEREVRSEMSCTGGVPRKRHRRGRSGECALM